MRKKAAAPLVASFLLAGCASGPVPPDWQIHAHMALKTHLDAYFDGNVHLAETEFARARAAVAKTGRLDLVASVELTRCARHAAAIDLPAGEPCPGFLPVAQDAGATGRAYHAYLAGRWQDLNPQYLPEQHATVAKVGAGGTVLATIDDPQARLVAAGAALRAGRLPPAGIAIAVETASAQGWRRPLLAWLGVQARHAESAGDPATAQRIRRRIALLSAANERHIDLAPSRD